MLGADALEGEANVVELEVLGYNDKKHKIPICVTKASPNYVTNVDVSAVALPISFLPSLLEPFPDSGFCSWSNSFVRFVCLFKDVQKVTNSK